MSGDLRAIKSAEDAKMCTLRANTRRLEDLCKRPTGAR